MGVVSIEPATAGAQARAHLVDSHCHLDLLDPRTLERGGVTGAVQRACENGVTHMLCVCLNLENFQKIKQIALSFSGSVSCSVGVHPNEPETSDTDRFEAKLLEVATDPGVVAIGETGLDYYRGSGDLHWQRERFRAHIRVARVLGLPLIVHCREAREDTLRILREEGADTVGGVMHCFVEDWDTASAAMDLDFDISFSGILTFRSAEALRKVARRIPERRLMVETDSPYLAPVPMRGKPNEPAFVRHVLEALAVLRGVPAEHLASATSENFQRRFPRAYASR